MTPLSAPTEYQTPGCRKESCKRVGLAESSVAMVRSEVEPRPVSVHSPGWDRALEAAGTENTLALKDGTVSSQECGTYTPSAGRHEASSLERHGRLCRSAVEDSRRVEAKTRNFGARRRPPTRFIGTLACRSRLAVSGGRRL